MTNLPITSNNPQSPAKTTQGDSPQPRNGSSLTSANAAATSQANSSMNDQAAEPFSVLLAQQIGEAGLSAPNTTQIFAIHGKAATSDSDPATKDTQGQTIIASSNSTDPVNALAAMLLQIPIQQSDMSSKSPGVDATLLHGDLSRLSREAGGIKQKMEDSLQRTADKSMGKNNALPMTGNSQPTDPLVLIPLSSDAIKHAEMTISSTGQSQLGQHITKAVISAAASAVLPNIMPNDIHTDTSQTLTTPLGNSGWADEFSQKIVWMSTQQNQIAELHLNPPDLGPLNVVLKISDNQLTAQFTSPHSAVRDAVENALPKLREILADNNITLGNATVSDQAPRDRGAEGFMNQGSGTAAQRDTSFSSTESKILLSTTSQSVPTRRHNGMLDIFA
jgi:flagellar hook-length control protein FliK